MPSKMHIDHEYESCFPCKFFSHQLWVSGLHPIYHTICNHPSGLRKSLFGDNLTGKVISREGHDQRPQWCPIRGDKEGVEGMDAPLVVRLKSRRVTDEIINALIEHRDNVWPQANAHE